MDIKDIILIGGGLLIAAVVVHGFWIAWKARRDPLRMDLVTNLPEDDEDDLKRLRAELPNGGARVVGQTEMPRQGHLELDPDALPESDAGDAPVLLEPSEPVRPDRRGSAGHGRKTEPRLDPAPSARPAPDAGQRAAGPDAGAPDAAPRPPHRPKELRPAAAERAGSRPKPAPAPRRESLARRKSAPVRPEQSEASREPRKAAQPVDELIVVNVIAPKGKPFVGGGVVEALRARGLRYGDMNIFHRIDPMTRTSLYGVANVVEPGTFDLSDLDNFRSPGVCFFLQLPGPEQPLDVFEDMLKAAREVAARVGGEVKDEQRSVMTGQTVEHYRQRISDFCRRRMSMRA